MPEDRPAWTARGWISLACEFLLAPDADTEVAVEHGEAAVEFLGSVGMAVCIATSALGAFKRAPRGFPGEA